MKTRPGYFGKLLKIIKLILKFMNLAHLNIHILTKYNKSMQVHRKIRRGLFRNLRIMHAFSNDISEMLGTVLTNKTV